MTIGYAPGVYDLFHIGHLNVLRHARAECDYLVAGVLTDDLALRVKGSTPIIPLSERLEIVEGLRCVDEVIVESNADKLDTWRSHPFDVIFKGNDWEGTEKGRALERDFRAVGVDVVYFPYTVHTSSSMLRRALAQLDERSVRATQRLA